MEIAQIKARLSILSVLARYGLRPDASGRMRCPFHDDTTPSFQVYAETNTFCCFSTNCEAGTGDVIDLVERMERCSTHEAILKAKAMIEPVPSLVPNGQAAGLNGAFARFKKSFFQSGKARAYLKQRGLDASRIDVGFNSGRFHGHQSNATNEAWVNVGLLTPHQGGYRVFARTCVIFPLKDKNGEITSLYGRSIRAAATTARHFYLKHRRGLYPGYPSKETRRLIVTESVIDAASLLMLDLPADTAPLALYGTNGFTGEHEAAIEDLESLEEIVLFFDGDQAGRAAVEKVRRRLEKLRPAVAISHVETLDDEDINSLLVTYDAECIKTLIQERATLYGPTSESPSSKEPLLQEGLDTTNAEALCLRTPNVVVTVLGGIKLTGLDRLRATLKLDRTDGGYPLRHNLDLYHAGQIDSLIDRAAAELDLSTVTLRSVMVRLIDGLEGYRLRKIEAMTPKQQRPTLSKREHDQARAYLSRDDLLERTSRDIGRSGVVGEEVNRLLMYLVFTSRLRQRPLHLMCLGQSGMGKTYLQESVGRLIPSEDRLEITALSENALYYFGRTELRHKLILIEDLDGAEEVLYPLRELQTKGKLSKTVTMKDAKGRLKTITVTVEGPVCVSGCTTRDALYDDNANRCLLLHLDTTPKQNQAILRYQKRLSAGAVNGKAQEAIRHLLKNTQRLLKPVGVRNPYAERLALPPLVQSQRRSNQLYLDVIETVTFYHQYQRQIKHDKATGERYILTTLDDIDAANKLMSSVLTTKSDELTGACRGFFDAVKAWMHSNDRQSFHAGEVRRALRLAPTSLKRHLWQLQNYGYIERVGGNRYHRGFAYQLTEAGHEGGLYGDTVTFLADRLNQLKQEETTV